MFKSCLLFTAMVLLMPGLASAQAHPPKDANQAPNAKDSAANTATAHARAKKLYELDCALCHGSTGDGKTDLAKDMQLTLLDWTNPKSLAGMSDEALFDAIRKGKGKMPPEDEGRAKSEEIKNLVIYIRRLGKDQVATPAAEPTVAPAPSTAPEAAPAPATSPAPSR